MPTCRCSRNACWAAAIDFGRPIVIGITTPGNSTVLRTGTMMRPSDGIARPLLIRRRAGNGLLGSIVDDMAISSTGFGEAQAYAAIGGETADGVTPRRQCNAALEPALRQLETVDVGIAQFRGKHRRPLTTSVPCSMHGFDVFGIDPGQRNEDQYFLLGLQHVDRRLPAWLVGVPATVAG